VETKKNLEKPLLRRKSDLPTDILTQKSLENYQVPAVQDQDQKDIYLFWQNVSYLLLYWNR
jgi:hypothetical protein